MKLEDYIAKLDEEVDDLEEDSDWGFGNRFIDRSELLSELSEKKQLLKWLKELKERRNDIVGVKNISGGDIP